MARQRKLILSPGFASDYFSIRRHIDVFDYCGLRIATFICYVAEFPELAHQAALRGADIILVPTALAQQLGRVVNQMMPTRGFENGFFWLMPIMPKQKMG